MKIAAAGERIIVATMIILCSVVRLGAEPVMMPLSGVLPPVLAVNSRAVPLFRYATDDLWQYLRKGLNYLESPLPTAAPEAVSPSYVHPDGKGFGCYGFSPGAYQDVQRLYPYFRAFSWDQVLKSPRIYDLANQAFCDWLLKNMQDYCPRPKNPSDVFDAVQQAWNLGLGGFKKGRSVVSSRARRAEEFKSGAMM